MVAAPMFASRCPGRAARSAWKSWQSWQRFSDANGFTVEGNVVVTNLTRRGFAAKRESTPHCQYDRSQAGLHSSRLAIGGQTRFLAAGYDNLPLMAAIQMPRLILWTSRLGGHHHKAQRRHTHQITKSSCSYSSSDSSSSSSDSSSSGSSSF
jgi:hypothetical protein